MDRLSNLSDELLLTIISFLPTHIAARTSMLSRRFRHLWKASPSLNIISEDIPEPQFDNFVSMADSFLYYRDPSLPLISFHLDVSSWYFLNYPVASYVSLFLSMARSLGLHHLTIGDINSSFAPVVPVIFSISTLKSLSLGFLPHPPPYDQVDFPSGTALTCLRSLSLKLHGTYLIKLNRLLSDLHSLEDLHLHVDCKHRLNISSKTIRKLTLLIWIRTPKLDALELFLPSLESLHLNLPANVSHINIGVPLLSKAKIALDKLHEKNVSTLVELLKYISHVEALSLRIEESRDFIYPIPILSELEEDMPDFGNLKHLDMIASFHKHNLEAVKMMLHHCPALESLNLIHEPCPIALSSAAILPSPSSVSTSISPPGTSIAAGLQLPTTAGSFGLRHLTIGTLNFGDFSYSCFASILPVIFSISTLNSLSLGLLPHPLPHGGLNSHSALPCDKVDFPSGTNLTWLRTLSLRLHGTYLAKLNRLLSELGSLEELHLHVDCKQGFNVSSETIRKLKLIIWARAPKLDAVELFLPSLESLYLELPANLSRIHMDTSLLRNAKVFLDELKADNIRTLVEILNCVPLVEELSLRLEESGLMKFPFPILPEPGIDMLNFPNLKHLNVHKHNIETVMTMLHHFPALESLNLVHEAAEISSYRARGRKMEDWESKLPLTADSNHPYAHFRNLHLGENRKELIKWISQKRTSKRKANN